jgi:hypothetical protein
MKTGRSTRFDAVLLPVFIETTDILIIVTNPSFIMCVYPAIDRCILGPLAHYKLYLSNNLLMYKVVFSG